MMTIPAQTSIRSSQELRALLTELVACVEDGRLEELRPVQPPVGAPVEIRHLLIAPHLPDFFEITFRAPSSGARYRLSVETFHGAGGAWECLDG